MQIVSMQAIVALATLVASVHADALYDALAKVSCSLKWCVPFSGTTEIYKTRSQNVEEKTKVGVGHEVAPTRATR